MPSFLGLALTAVALGLAAYLFAGWYTRTPKRPEPKPAPPIRRGPHSTLSMSRSDEGYFVLIQSPLHAENAVLLTQVFFDEWGAPRVTRFAKADPLVIGSIQIGRWYGTPVSIPFGIYPQKPDTTIRPGSQLVFADDPLTTWFN
ncbi:hypothetical protein [uncultured Hyphomicrobium sp.]|jgi:hypothetical protein|uniref:hypothetical protein n=1 Tax=uncultured Hyphomicrobium sp. TaxID=194373 RepID=UPI0025ED64B8|nr:hypothetical protein [uncultured Hyphomicrobium sp.]